MESIINEKKKLYQTLLSFPPFFTYAALYFQGCSSMSNHGKNKLVTGANWSILIAESNAFIEEFRNNIINSSISEISNLPIVEDKSSTISSMAFIMIRKTFQRRYNCDHEGVVKIRLLRICNRNLENTNFSFQPLRNGWWFVSLGKAKLPNWRCWNLPIHFIRRKYNTKIK